MVQKQDIFTLIGGRVHMKRGRYNPTSDAVWLAATAAGIPGKTVLDVGIGTGGAALCMMAHRPDIQMTGIDICEQMLDECAGNTELNNREIELIHGDITTWRTPRTFDIVITNPPYFQGTPAHHNAHHNADLTAWTRTAAARVRPRGHMCVITDARAMDKVIAAMTAAGFGDITIFPLTGGDKMSAERVIIHARAGVRGGARIMRPVDMGCAAVLRDGLTIDDALATLDGK